MTRVLLAEDDPAISEPLARALRREGYDVDVREDGAAALDGAKENPDLVLLDLGLPRIDGLGGGASQQRPHPGEQLGQAERLRDVVVGARVEAHDGVHLVGAGREDEDGDGTALGADATAHLEPVDLRQSEVEQHEVGVLLGTVEGGQAVLAHVDVVALPPQRTGQRFGDGWVVLRQEHSGHVTVLKICRSGGAPTVVSLSTTDRIAP